MINFVHLVESLVNLTEADTTTASVSSTSESETLNSFLKTGKVYQTLQSVFNNKYGATFPFPNETEFVNVASTAANSFSRYTHSSDKYDERFLMNAYPLLDLFAQLYQVLKGRSGGDVREAQKILDGFIANIKKDNIPKIPLDYPAIIQWAKDVKADYFATNKQAFGQARLDNIQPPTLGIYSTILYLLAIRRNSNKSKLPIDKIPPAQDFIKKIFFNPQVYINGTQLAPQDERVALLYNEITVRKLIETAHAAYQLFKQQLISVLNPKDGKIQNEQEAYAEFIGNGEKTSSVPFDWSKYKQQEAETEQQTTQESFKSLIATAYRHLNENYWLDGEEKQPSKPSSNNPPPETLRPFETTEHKFQYNLETIKKHKQDIPQAETLYKKMLDLADYIQKEQETDVKTVVQGIGQMAKGLSLGVPSMGSR